MNDTESRTDIDSATKEELRPPCDEALFVPGGFQAGLPPTWTCDSAAEAVSCRRCIACEHEFARLKCWPHVSPHDHIVCESCFSKGYVVLIRAEPLR